MCIGIPMQVIAVQEFQALCADGERRERVDTTLVGRPPVGSWLLVFLGSAREVLDADTALGMRDAVEAVGRVMGGDRSIDDLFADLVDPASGPSDRLPDHLKPPSSNAVKPATEPVAEPFTEQEP